MTTLQARCGRTARYVCIRSREIHYLTALLAQYPIRLILNGQASSEIEWHCKHYVGRGLMKRFESGEALAKEMGIPASVLKKTFDDYNTVAKTKKDPFGKKVRNYSLCAA